MSRSFILIFDKILQRFTIYHALSVWCMAFTMQINYNISKNSICKCEFLPSHALLLFVMSNMGMIPRWSGGRNKGRARPGLTVFTSSLVLLSALISVQCWHPTTTTTPPKTSDLTQCQANQPISKYNKISNSWPHLQVRTVFSVNWQNC